MTSNAMIALATALLLAAPVVAQETITSDRPGIGSGAGIVTAGIFQVEIGADFAEDSTNRTYSVGQMLVRIGLSTVELEVFLNSFVTTRTDFQDGPIEGEGLLDFAIGAKAPLVRAESVAVSLQGIVVAPTGSDIFSEDEWIPALNVLADVTVTDRFAVSVNSGYRTGPGAVTDQVTFFVTPGVALDDGLGVYAGWAGFFGGDDTHVAEAGLTLLLNRNLQFDVNGGWDVQTDDFFLGAGASFRWGG